MVQTYNTWWRLLLLIELDKLILFVINYLKAFANSLGLLQELSHLHIFQSSSAGHTTSYPLGNRTIIRE
jgi:hypothetical protein